MWIVLEFLFEIVDEVLVEIGKAFLDRRLLVDLLWELSYLLCGVTLGAGSLWLFPQRVFAPGPIPGLSLLLAAVSVGALAALWGRFRSGQSWLGTWDAGAQLGFGVAVVRYLAFLR